MKKYLLIACGILFVLSSCSKVPITGRKQLNLLPESQMMTMSLAAYTEFLDTSNVVNSGSDKQLVATTGQRISNSVTAYLRKKKKLKRVKDFQWEFNLVDSPDANAWAMPGGKVVFYTGILPITQDQNGLAVVMGHEVAHAIARHGNERMSQGLALNLGGLGLAVALSQKPAATQNLFLQAYGIGTSLGMLKYSRKHEGEADKMGLVFMAMAGYDPRQAPEFWKRMQTLSNGQAPPEFMSTHPSHETRIKELNEFMPEAMKFYDPANAAPNLKTKNDSKRKDNKKTKPGGSGSDKSKNTSGDPKRKN